MYLDLHWELFLETVLDKCNTHLFGMVEEEENEVVQQKGARQPLNRRGLAGRQGQPTHTQPRQP